MQPLGAAFHAFDCDGTTNETVTQTDDLSVGFDQVTITDVDEDEITENFQDAPFEKDSHEDDHPPKLNEVNLKLFLIRYVAA